MKFCYQCYSIPHFPISDLSNEHFSISFTSGTTGPPKGAIHSHRSFIGILLNSILPPKYRGLKLAMSLPLGHISGCLFMPQALDCGMTVVLFDRNDTDYIIRSIDRCRIEHYLFSLNSCTEMANKHYYNKYDLTCLKQLRFGGCKFPANLLELLKDKYNVELLEIYGATEFMELVNSVLTDPTLLKDNFQAGNLGPVMANVEMKVIDLKSGHSLPALVHGELCFRGEPCFIGYLNNEEATKSTFDKEGWYHSGDVGYYDEKECLLVTDRIKELIKYKLWSLVPVEIEQFLYTHQAVAGVCIVGVAHITDGYLIRAYVQLVQGKSVTEQELIDFVKENLGSQKQLRAGVRFVDEIPRTAVGKVDRQYFKKLVKHELITEQVD